jgi:hypothetical protein
MMTNDVGWLRAAETESDRWRRVLAEKGETNMIRGLPRLDAEREAFRHLTVEYLKRSLRRVWQRNATRRAVLNSRR